MWGVCVGGWVPLSSHPRHTPATLTRQHTHISRHTHTLHRVLRSIDSTVGALCTRTKTNTHTHTHRHTPCPPPRSCVAGISRSSTVCIGWLMWKHKITYDEAFRCVCVCVCVHACAHECVCYAGSCRNTTLHMTRRSGVCVCVCVCVSVGDVSMLGVHAHVCVHLRVPVCTSWLMWKHCTTYDEAFRWFFCVFERGGLWPYPESARTARAHAHAHTLTIGSVAGCAAMGHAHHGHSHTWHGGGSWAWNTCCRAHQAIPDWLVAWPH